MKNKLNCIIIHGCPSKKAEFIAPGKRTYYRHWILWAKEQISEMGISTENPLMPAPWIPVYEDFKKEFEKYKVDENTILIGHSCGCAFLVRWLGESKKNIKKLILVAPWKVPWKNGEHDPIREKFYIYPIDETIKSRVGEIVMFTSDNEREDGKKSLEIYRKSLGGKIIELKGKGHYTFKDMGTNEFPELLQEISL